MEPSNFISMVLESYHRILDKLTLLNISLRIKLPGEVASPFSMVFVGFILIVVTLVINVIVRHITLQRIIEDPFLNMGVYFVLTQLIALGVVVGVTMIFKGIDYALKRL